jgi:hypothetical protein
MVFNNEAQARQLVKMTFYLGVSKAAVRQSTLNIAGRRLDITVAV